MARHDKAWQLVTSKSMWYDIIGKSHRDSEGQQSQICWPFFMPKGGIAVPSKPKKPCAFPGCPKLTLDVYCEEHASLRQKQYDRYNRAPNHDKKYGNNWKRIRGLYVKKHPLCERCLKEGRITPVEEVHHIVPLSRGGTNQFSNLMSLCQSCHTIIHYEIGDRS
jgi:5-methylcytosine-specific restriction enzyme A